MSKESKEKVLYPKVHLQIHSNEWPQGPHLDGLSKMLNVGLVASRMVGAMHQAGVNDIAKRLASDRVFGAGGYSACFEEVFRTVTCEFVFPEGD